MPDDPQQYLDPLALAKVRSLELQARLIVEGYLSGMHKSPYHVFSVEFAQHREYAPGADNKHVHWTAYARTVRVYRKQWEEEPHFVCRMWRDVSESLRYGSGPVSKYDYAWRSAAAMAYLTLRQQDSIGFVTYDDQVRTFLKPSSQPARLKEMVNLMNRGCGAEKTSLEPIFHDLAERINRRSIIVVLSDLFDEP